MNKHLFEVTTHACAVLGDGVRRIYVRRKYDISIIKVYLVEVYLNKNFCKDDYMVRELDNLADFYSKYGELKIKFEIHEFGSSGKSKRYRIINCISDPIIDIRFKQ